MEQLVPTRRTKQKAAVTAMLGTLRRFHTAQEIHAMLVSQGSRVGLATVYRNLQVMVEAGEVDAIRTPDGQLAYRACGSGHHHHLMCRDCGRTEEIEVAGVEELLFSTARAHGFSGIHHELEMYGLCEACGSRQSGNADLPR